MCLFQNTFGVYLGIEPRLVRVYKQMCLLYVSLKEPPVGIEPTIFRLEGGRLIHLATEAECASLENLFSSTGFEPATPGILFEYFYSYHYNPMLYQLS